MSRQVAPRGRAHLVVGVIALLGFVLETFLLGGRLEWLDAYVATAARAMCTGDVIAMLTSLTKASPFIAAGFVIAGVIASARSKGDAREIVSILTQLAIGLVLVEVLKALFQRARPGALPWGLTGDSFPSGHVANAVLCIATVYRLLPNRPGDPHARFWHVAVAVVGVLFVPAVAFTRVALARHWLTDVTGSVMLAGAFVALAPLPNPPATRRLALMLPIALIGIGVPIATGARIRLPSPSTLEMVPSEAVSEGDFVRAIEIDDEAFTQPGSGDDELTLLSPAYGKQWAVVHNGRSAVFKVLARTVRLDGIDTAYRLELLVDGGLVGVQPLWPSWRALAFALPELEPGPHEFELRSERKALRTSVAWGRR